VPAPWARDGFCVGLVISAFALVRVNAEEAARTLDTARAVLAGAGTGSSPA